MILAECFIFFFFNDTATTEIYTLSLHDALPISYGNAGHNSLRGPGYFDVDLAVTREFKLYEQLTLQARAEARSEEHTSELQSPCNLVCRLLLEKKKYCHTHSVTSIRLCLQYSAV